jgi:hypothetical protein
MALTRRSFLSGAAGAGALATVLAKPEAAAAINQALQDAAEEPEPGNAAAFWGTFLEPSLHARGLMPHHRPGTDADRQVNYLHYGTKGLRYADQIPSSELPDYPGDVTVSMNVGGIRLSKADRAKFEELKSAQLRIDMLQGEQMYNLIDPLAWMALAGIFPDQAGSLPPLQNLNFDPATTAQNMEKIVLPGGFGHMAVNVSMVHRESAFFRVLTAMVTDAAQVAPVLGLPAISVLANRSTFLFQARPEVAYATQEARKKADSTIGINLPEGDYVLVPQAHTDDLAPYIDKLKLDNGYLVPRNAPGTASVYETAENAQPDISYITMHVGVSRLVQMGNPQSGGSGAAGGSGSAKKAGKS